MTTIPTIQELYNNIISDINTEYGTDIPEEGKAFLRALAATQAASLKLYYLATADVQKNIWPDTADPVEVGGTLQRFGLVKLDRYPYPATAGVYTATVTGTTGAVIPALTQFKSDDTSLNPSYLFILDSAYTMPSGMGTISIRALTAGRESLLDIGNTLTATAPILNVNSQITIATISTDPVNAETIEEYRAKVIQAYRLTPQGGAVSDYILWGLDASGTRKIYPYVSSAENNELNVYVEALPADSTDGHGTPTPTILTDVEADIEADPVSGIGRRPLGTFLVNVLPIDALAVDITIDSGGTITPAQETTVMQALEEDVYLIRPFIAGADDEANRKDTISEFGIGNVVIQAIGGVVISSILLVVDGDPVGSYQFDNGEIPYINSVTFL